MPRIKIEPLEEENLKNGIGRHCEAFTRYSEGLNCDYIHFFKFAESLTTTLDIFSKAKDTVFVKFDIPDYIIQQYPFGKGAYKYKNKYEFEENIMRKLNNHELEVSNLTRLEKIRMISFYRHKIREKKIIPLLYQLPID